MAKNYCSCCGASIKESDVFCSECGFMLKMKSNYVPNNEDIEQPIINGPVVNPFMPNMNTSMGKLAKIDDDLQMLGEYCTKTVATVGGDGYTEWVLYRNPQGELQLHYFRNYMGYENEIHNSCIAPTDTYEKMLAIKDECHLTVESGKNSHGMPGGYEYIKICIDNEVIRLNTGNLTDEELSAFKQVKQLLTSIN